MTRQRDPQTIPGAVMRVVGALTPEHCADRLNKSPRQVRRFTDDGDDGTPITLADAVRLDADYVNAGLGEAPILKVYAAELAGRTESAHHPVAGVLVEMLDVDDVQGQLAAAIRRAVAPGGEGGRKITPSEAMAALDLVEKLKIELTDVGDAIRREAKMNDKGHG